MKFYSSHRALLSSSSLLLMSSSPSPPPIIPHYLRRRRLPLIPSYLIIFVVVAFLHPIIPRCLHSPRCCSYRHRLPPSPPTSPSLLPCPHPLSQVSPRGVSTSQPLFYLHPALSTPSNPALSTPSTLHSLHLPPCTLYTFHPALSAPSTLHSLYPTFSTHPALSNLITPRALYTFHL